jgi:hypothetical protein
MPHDNEETHMNETPDNEMPGKGKSYIAGKIRESAENDPKPVVDDGILSPYRDEIAD